MRKFFALSLAVLLLSACSDESDETAAPGGGGGGGEEVPEFGAYLVCPPGELELDDGSCLAPGVPADGCGEGFTHDGDVGCAAILPSVACPLDLMAIPGDTVCREVALCGAGTWGNLPTAAGTIFVQANASGGTGSQAAPFATIQEAVDAAADGATIVIAAGTYSKVTIDKAVKLYGVCPQSVAINGGLSDAVLITADNVELHGLGLTGSYNGVMIQDAADVLLDALHIRYTGFTAVNQVGGVVTLSNSLLSHNGATSVLVSGGELTIDKTMVRDVDPGLGGDFGYGINVTDDPFSGLRGTLTVRQSHVSFARAIAVAAWGSDMVIEDTIVADTLPRASDQDLGIGVNSYMNATSFKRAHVTVRGSVVERSRWCGICAQDGDLVIERSVSRDTDSQESEGLYGFGVRAFNWSPGASEEPKLSVSHSLIERSHLMGLAVTGATADVRATVIRDVYPRVADDRMGRLISVEPSQQTARPSSITLTGSKLERGYESGMMIIGCTADLESVWVHDIQPHSYNGTFGVGIAYVRDIFNELDTGGVLNNVLIENAYTVGLAALGSTIDVNNLITRNIQAEEATGSYGDGIIASEWIFVEDLYDTKVTLDRVTVEEAPRAGIVTFSAEVSIANSALECNSIQLDKESVKDGSPKLSNLGGNHCGCGEETEDCKVLTTNIEPPLPPL